MTTKLSRKLLACILVVAICITTVFGCLITANAANASWAFGEGSVNDELTEATINVTLTPPSVTQLPDGAFGAAFTLVEADKANPYLVLKSVVSQNDAVAASSSTEDISDNEIANIVLDSDTAITSVTLKLTFGFSAAISSDSEFTVGIDSVTYAGQSDSESFTETASVSAVISAGCAHVITIDNESKLVQTDSANGYSVYTNSVCSLCGERFDYQVIPTALPGGEVLYWDASRSQDATLADNGEAGTADDPIIIDSVAELAYIADAKNTKAYSTVDKYFKLKDGVKAVVLQPESDVATAIMDLDDAAAVKAYFEANGSSMKNWVNSEYNTTYAFQGNFDGNGATVYGLYWNALGDLPDGHWQRKVYTGLFPVTGEGVVISNISVANSYMTVSDNIGAITSHSRNSATKPVTIEGCAVINCYMRCNNPDATSAASAGVLAGNMWHKVVINNCLVYGNDAVHTDITLPDGTTGFNMPLIANQKSAAEGEKIITNTVALGCTPYPQYNFAFHLRDYPPYKNVYTDQEVENILNYYTNLQGKFTFTYEGITKISASDVMGESAKTTLKGFDFDTVWATDVNGGCVTFAKDVAEIEVSGVVDTWQWTSSEINWYDKTLADNGETGTADDPIIIDSAEEFAHLASNNGSEVGKYYKVADGIKAFNMSATVDMSGDMTPAEVEAALNTTCLGKTWWGTNFTGAGFDGNGVTIYGLQGYNTQYGGSGGLFNKVYGGVTIKNLTLKNSYFLGDATGALFGSVASESGKTITIENVVLTGNVVVCTRSNGATGNGGVMFGSSNKAWNEQNNVRISNCLVYNNLAKHQGYYSTKTGYDITYGLFGTSGAVNDVYTHVENSIILDSMPCSPTYSWAGSGHVTFSNVYTNMIGAEVKNVEVEGTPGETNYSVTHTCTLEPQANGSVKIHVVAENRDNKGLTQEIASNKAAGSFHAVNAADIKGLQAEQTCASLDFDTVWTTDVNGGYPTPFAAYNGTISAESAKSLNLKGVNLTYEDDGSFSLNFHYEPAYTGFAPDLYVAQADLSGFMILKSSGKSPFAGTILADDAIVYTIPHLSAREIGDTLLPTIIAASGDTAIWGKTEQISIADYAAAVISGEAVYTKDASATVMQQDKDVAAAVINYGAAAKAALTQGYDGTAVGGKTIYWDGSKTAPTKQVDGTYIINTAAELAYVANSATTGSYKIADDIGTIIMQPQATIEAAGGVSKLIGLSSYEETKAYFEDLKEKSADLKSWVTKGSSNCFLGTFDGNGADIYGLYYNDSEFASWSNCALFPSVGYSATIKNVAVKNSYIVAWSYAAALVGYAEGYINSVANNGTVHIDNCEVANCYIGSGHNSYRAGVMLGAVGSQTTVKKTAEDGTETQETIKYYVGVSVNNCLVYGNKAISKMIPGTNAESGLYGSLSNFNPTTEATYSVDNQIENSIILDCTPYQVDGGANATQPDNFNKVYTNVVTPKPAIVNYPSWLGLADADQVWAKFSDKIFVLDDVTKATGGAAVANLANLDWSRWAFGAEGEYPTPIAATKSASAGKIVYWNGTRDTTLADNGEAGTAADPIIIDSAEELAQLVREKEENTFGKNYKIADDIDAIILQPETVVDDAAELMSLSSAAAVQKYFEDKIEAGIAPIDWKTVNYVWNGIFNGNFDGNGVEIYGLYSNSDNAALFFMVDGGGETADDTEVETINEGGITIKNLEIRNSYLVSSNRLGAIVGQAYGNGTGATAGARVDGVINIDSCLVANCYMRETGSGMHSRAGILSGDVGTDLVKINNCLVYGNDAKDSYLNLGLSLRASGQVRKDADGNYVYNKVSNTIVLGSSPYPTSYYSWIITTKDCFDNVYTDQAVGTVTLPRATGGDPVTQDYSNITKVAPADMLGDKAADVVAAINAANGDSRDMYVGNAWSYPSFEKASIMPAANQSVYDALVLSNADEYGDSTAEFGMYGTSLNLKTNPYIAFTFAFLNYKKSDAVEVTITTADGKSVTAKASEMVNNEGAGRYHLYRFTDVPVKYLCQDITVTASIDGGEAIDLGSYSVEGFALAAQNANKKDPCKYYATRYEAAKALLYYSQMLNVRYGK